MFTRQDSQKKKKKLKTLAQVSLGFDHQKGLMFSLKLHHSQSVGIDF